ncbi:hypothetical protein EAI_14702 [Harpegnathos saltator]|uniref:Uncharacterized protein n=1 Tax=Harpegnathos saltator TaxID=610380 RepID=E2BV64_HARSA|nr:hypothetical protein EAI_14702 [Harpegnathos saltator]
MRICGFNLSCVSMIQFRQKEQNIWLELLSVLYYQYRLLRFTILISVLGSHWMINGALRYLSHSRENFSKIPLSALSDNGISIPHERRQTIVSDISIAVCSLGKPPIPKKGDTSSRSHREKVHEDEVPNGGEMPVGWAGRPAGNEEQEEKENDGTWSRTGGLVERRKGTRISYKALLSGWVAEVAIVLRFDSGLSKLLIDAFSTTTTTKTTTTTTTTTKAIRQPTITSWLYRPATAIFYRCPLLLLVLHSTKEMLSASFCDALSTPPADRLHIDRNMSCLNIEILVLTIIGPPAFLEAETVAPNHCNVLLSIGLKPPATCGFFTNDKRDQAHMNIYGRGYMGEITPLVVMAHCADLRAFVD